MQYKRSVLSWIQLFWERFMEANSEMWLCFSNTPLWTEQRKLKSWSACHPKPKPDFDKFSGDVTWKIHCECLFCAVHCWILNFSPEQRESIEFSFNWVTAEINITVLHMYWVPQVSPYKPDPRLQLCLCMLLWQKGFQKINKVLLMCFWLNSQCLWTLY